MAPPIETHRSVTRTGAVAAPAGAVMFFVSTMLHPMDRDPNDAAAAFAEYAADSLWVWSHLGQFMSVAVLAVALAALASTLDHGRAAIWARMGMIGTAATVALAAALQAVDGVALKVMVDRWAAAGGEARTLAFEAALAVRQVEIGLASLFSVVFGCTALVIGLATLLSGRYPAWFGVLGVAVGIGMMAAGTAMAFVGFAGAAMMLSMSSSYLFFVWIIVAAVLMWRSSNFQRML